MNEDKPKSNKNLISIVIFIIIVFILFTVNIKSVVNSSSFQTNINYIEQKIDDIWNKYILSFLKTTILGNTIKPDQLNITNLLNSGEVQKGIQAITNTYKTSN